MPTLLGGWPISGWVYILGKEILFPYCNSAFLASDTVKRKGKEGGVMHSRHEGNKTLSGGIKRVAWEE